MITYIISFKDGEYRQRNLEYILFWLNGLKDIFNEVLIIEQDNDSKLEEVKLKRINPQVKHIFQQSDSEFNKCKAYNLGIDNSTNEWLGFGDSDVFMFPRDIRKSINIAFRKNVETFCPYNEMYYLNKNEAEFLIRRNNRRFIRKKHLETGDGTRSPYYGGISFIRKKIFDNENNRWDESYQGWGGEDIRMSKILEDYGQNHYKGRAYHLYHKEKDWN